VLSITGTRCGTVPLTCFVAFLNFIAALDLTPAVEPSALGCTSLWLTLGVASASFVAAGTTAGTLI